MSSVVVVVVDVLGGVAELGLVLGPYSRWIASTSASASFTWRATCHMERLCMEAQDGLKTIAPPLFLNIFFYFLLVKWFLIG